MWNTQQSCSTVPNRIILLKQTVIFDLILIFKESKIRLFQFSGISQVLWFIVIWCHRCVHECFIIMSIRGKYTLQLLWIFVGVGVCQGVRSQPTPSQTPLIAFTNSSIFYLHIILLIRVEKRVQTRIPHKLTLL